MSLSCQAPLTAPYPRAAVRQLLPAAASAAMKLAAVVRCVAIISPTGLQVVTTAADSPLQWLQVALSPGLLRLPTVRAARAAVQSIVSSCRHPGGPAHAQTVIAAACLYSSRVLQACPAVPHTVMWPACWCVDCWRGLVGGMPVSPAASGVSSSSYGAVACGAAHTQSAAAWLALAHSRSGLATSRSCAAASMLSSYCPGRSHVISNRSSCGGAATASAAAPAAAWLLRRNLAPTLPFTVVHLFAWRSAPAPAPASAAAAPPPSAAAAAVISACAPALPFLPTPDSIICISAAQPV